MMFSAAARPRRLSSAGHVGEPVRARVGVDGREDRAPDAEGFVQDLRDRREAVHGRGRVGHDAVLRPDPVVVDAHDDRDVGRLERRRQQDDAPRSGRQMRLGLGARAPAGSRLEHRVDAELAPPRDGRLILAGEQRDAPASDDQRPALHGDLPGEPAQQGVELQEVGEAFRLREVADGADPDVVSGVEDSEEIAADPPEAEDPHARHGIFLPHRPGGGKRRADRAAKFADETRPAVDSRA